MSLKDGHDLVSVRPSSSTISKIFFFETAGPIVLILHLQHLQVRGKIVFCFDRIRTLVAMATYASHRLTMEKVKIRPKKKIQLFLRHFLEKTDEAGRFFFFFFFFFFFSPKNR